MFISKIAEETSCVSDSMKVESYMIKKILLIGLAIFIAGTCLLFALTIKTPIPPDINIFAPDPSLPDEVQALSGKWVGQWDSKWGWDCVIYVEKVDKDSAQVTHSWGGYTTSKGSCHCDPDWRRIQRAEVNYSEGKATLEFLVPPYRPLKGPNPSHMVTGSVDPSRPYYFFSFTVEKKKPDIMKGLFISAKRSRLYISMKKMD